MRKKYLKEKLARVIDERDKLKEKMLDMSEDWRIEVANLRNDINRISRASKIEIANWREIAQFMNSDNVDERNLGYSLYDAQMRDDDYYMLSEKSRERTLSNHLRILYCFNNKKEVCGTCIACRSADEIEVLQQAVDNVIEQIERDHTPMWASKQAKEKNKKPFGCEHCSPQESGWPCTYRAMLDELRAVRGRYE